MRARPRDDGLDAGEGRLRVDEELDRVPAARVNRELVREVGEVARWLTECRLRGLFLESLEGTHRERRRRETRRDRSLGALAPLPPPADRLRPDREEEEGADVRQEDDEKDPRQRGSALPSLHDDLRDERDPDQVAHRRHGDRDGDPHGSQYHPSGVSTS